MAEKKLEVKQHIKDVPRNYALDGKRIGIGGAIKNKDGKVLFPEATQAQYKKLQSIFPGMFEEKSS